MANLRECCPSGYEYLDFTFDPPTCYYRRRDFDERLLVGLGRWVDPAKPPVPADCTGQSSVAPGGVPTRPPGGAFRFKESVVARRRRMMHKLPHPPGGGMKTGRPTLRRTFGPGRPNVRPFIGGSEPPGGPSIPGGGGGGGGFFGQGGLFGTGIEGTDILDFIGGFFDRGGGGGGGGGGQTVPTVPFVPDTGGKDLSCPGAMSIYVPGVGCVNLGDLGPGGPPAVTGTVTEGDFLDEYGPAVKGIYGAGITPRVESQTVRRCPPGFALGKDGVCYEGLGRNSPRRMWPMGMKPLLTPGDRAAIRKAKAAASKLSRSKKSLKKASRALEKAC